MSRKIHTPRVMIAAPKSGSGKTFLTCGLLRMLQQDKLQVSSFKCGPDYIDPMFHRRVLGMPSKNLDTYFTNENLTRYLFAESAENSDISVMEGVMGYFDGMSLQEWTASSYDLAKTTQTPVILVVDAGGMSRSVIPLIRGFLEYGEQHLIQGVILNRVSPMLYPSLREKIEEELPVQVLGYLPKCPDYVWKSRHLGLFLPEEVSCLQEQIDGLAAIMRETVDLQKIRTMAENALDLEIEEPDLPEEVIRKKQTGEKIRIGVARDEAFCFYYEDNLRLLEKMGAEIIPFSPLKDSALPAVDGLLFGGGYPELYGKQLADNVCMRAAVKEAAGAGMPILGECGGFMYLQEQMTDLEGRKYPMAGALGGETYPAGKLVRFGYLELQENMGLQENMELQEKKIKGHEFHYFESTECGSSCHAVKPQNGKTWNCMVREKGIFAGFPHLYYYSNPEFVRTYLEKCAVF